MELLGLVSFVFFFIFFFLSLSQFLGFGWAMVIIDLLTFQASSNYSDVQNNYPKSKTKKGRTIGILFLVLAICCISIALFTL